MPGSALLPAPTNEYAAFAPAAPAYGASFPVAASASPVRRVDGRDTVPAVAVSSGFAPSRCVRHHRQAVSARRLSLYSSTHPLLYLLLLLSVFVFAVVALVLRKTVAAPRWPFCDECVRLRRRNLWIMTGCLIGWLPVFLLATGLAAVSETLGLVAALLALVLPLVGAAWYGHHGSYAWLVGGRVARDGMTVSFPLGTFPREPMTGGVPSTSILW